MKTDIQRRIASLDELVASQNRSLLRHCARCHVYPRQLLLCILSEHYPRYCAPFLSVESNAWNGDGAVERVASTPRDAAEERFYSLGTETPEIVESPVPLEDEALATSQPPIPTKTNPPAKTEDPPVENENEPPGQKRNPTPNDGSLARSSTCRRRRLRVGFLSAFFYHHSVGLLTEGVLNRLDRRRFETTAIFLQPHPTSTSPVAPGEGSKDSRPAEEDGESGGDGVYKAVRAGSEHVLDVPTNR